MYDTCMRARQDHLRRLDGVLLALRRVTSAPTARPVLAEGETRVELSTLLVIDAVARHDETGGGCSVSVVAEALAVAQSTASRLVARAVDAGVISRARDSSEARRALLRLTAAGEQLQAEAVRFRTLRLADVTSGWSDEDLATLTGLLERFAADARPHLSEPPAGRPRHGRIP